MHSFSMVDICKTCFFAVAHLSYTFLNAKSPINGFGNSRIDTKFEYLIKPYKLHVCLSLTFFVDLVERSLQKIKPHQATMKKINIYHTQK